MCDKEGCVFCEQELVLVQKHFLSVKEKEQGVFKSVKIQRSGGETLTFEFLLFLSMYSLLPNKYK